jgi:EAL domain-containing protein (putative c-di-GMP-specific phosphodiesterase class I)
MPEDESWWAELLVRQVGQGFAKVALLRKGELDAIDIDPQIAKDFNIEYRGAVKKHRVVRIADGHVLKEGLPTVEDAQAWIRDHRRVLAA